MGDVIRRQFTKPRVQGETEAELTGVLRAVHLDEDWLEITVDGEHIRVFDVGETADDVVGPLVNRGVIVQTVTRGGGRILFRDIEAAPQSAVLAGFRIGRNVSCRASAKTSTKSLREV
jgi:hypothetical protein